MSKNSFDDVLFKEVKMLEDGKYRGLIVDVSRDTETYDYIRYKVAVKDSDVSLSLSFPTAVTFTDNGEPSSQHAKFLVEMGHKIQKDKSVNDAVYANLNKEIDFLVTQKKSKTGTFSEIVKDSVKLVA